MWLTFVLVEGTAFAVLSGPEELLAAFLFKLALACIICGWQPVNGRVQLWTLRLNPNLFLGASQLLVGLQSLMMYAYPYEDCLALPTDLVAVHLLFMAAVVTLLVLFLVADLLITAVRCKDKYRRKGRKKGHSSSKKKRGKNKKKKKKKKRSGKVSAVAPESYQ